jgi:hypothetical protein
MRCHALPEIMPSSAIKHSLTLALFSLTLVISAAAMFILQLMAGKMLLPITGGTPAGWIVALAFFQLALLAGYAMAFWLSRYSPRTHGAVYIAALGAGFLCLPVSLQQGAEGGMNAATVFRLLALSAGMPAVALAATSTTIQRLFISTGHGSADDPYFLYAASNLGSMAGLLLYPVITEAEFTLAEQSRLWLYAYALLIAFGLCCMCLSGKGGKADTAPEAAPWKQRREWALLSFFPSSLLLGVTMYITTAIIAAPLIWVLPMVLYLLTFVLAFSKPLFASGRRIFNALTAAVVFSPAILLMVFFHLPWAAYGHLLAFTLVAYAYHAQLARLRPEKRQLPDFYLMIATGGAVGGVLNAFIAPLAFSQQLEYPVVAVLACLLHPAVRSRFRRGNVTVYAAGAVIALALAYSLFRPLISLDLAGAELRAATRSFFGISRVYDEKVSIGNSLRTVRVLEHGTTTHGLQVLSPEYEREPAAYYAAGGPVGDIFAAFNPRSVAVVGLGTGNIACYGTPRRHFTFIEIDPSVIDIAQTWFTYLKKCPGARAPRLIEGDGRIELSRIKSEKFDLIVLDAFSSDMVPTHLLTEEAINQYLSHLEKNGAVVFHITNRYLQLEKLLSAAAFDMGLDFRWKVNTYQNGPLFMPGTWAILARQGEGLERIGRFRGWEKQVAAPGIRPWTDDYSSVMAVFGR